MPETERRRMFEAALSDEVYRAAWGYACRLCTAGGACRSADAEDLLQEALLRAYQCIHQLRDPARFKGWLLSILRTSHIDRLRRTGQPVEDVDGLAAPELEGVNDPLAEMVLAALSQLPPAQREILSLFYLEGLNLAETGQVLGIAPRIVRQRLFRAREALRRHTARLSFVQPGGLGSPRAKEGVTP